MTIGTIIRKKIIMMTMIKILYRFCGAEFFVKNFPCDPGLKRIFAYPLDTKEK